jgi:hypothetical protein
LAKWICLKLGSGASFEVANIPYKFHSNWTGPQGTSFTTLCTGQKLAGILENKRLNKIGSNLVERVKMVRRMSWQNFRNYEAVQNVVASQTKKKPRDKDGNAELTMSLG